MRDLPRDRINSNRRTHVFVQLALLLCFNQLTVSADDSAQRLQFFESKIRPVLIEHCYSCHSAQSDDVKGGLLLDTAAGLLNGGDSGPSLTTGKPDQSLLIEALRYDGLEMPPAGKLPDNVISDFEKWVATGATDPRSGPAAEVQRSEIDIEAGRQFWAFQPFRDHRPPTTSGNAIAATTIDAFVDAKLQKANITKNPATDAASLARRLYFDLTGLPPSADDVKHAIANGNDQYAAIETIVDLLIDSPQFGVQWGRHWLDVARYADSNGGDFNATFHNAWKYRDYVVESMNADKPFDQFIREQIAGDLLPYDNDAQRTQQLVATGFLMLGTKMLSERDKEKLTMDVVDEQINTVGSAFLGMTLGCARCHDHKFDPIPTRDYYALAGIFRSTRTLQGESQKYVSTWPRMSLPTNPEHVQAVKDFETRKKQMESDLEQAKKSLASLQKQAKFDSRLLIDNVDAKLIGQWKESSLSPSFVGKGYIHDDRKGKGEKAVEYSWTPPKSALYDVRLSYTSNSSRAKNIPVSIRHAEGQVKAVLDQTKKPEIDATFSSIGRFPFEAGKQATVEISTSGTVGYVIADAVQFVEVTADGTVVESKGDRDDKRIQSQIADQQSSIKALTEAVAELKKNAPAPLPQAIAVEDLPQTGDCEICIRGEHNNRGKIVPRGFLQVASYSSATMAPNRTSGRLELADWIASPDHPLTARVIVNRVWQKLIGEGIVRSVDNFGELGERPTHPELLDHLASRFVTPADQKTKFGAPGFGWSIKSLVREIVLSNTYQRSSDHNEDSWRIDPENRLLWKAHRRRLPAESLRDAVLSVSGQLDLSPGGSPVEGLGTLVKNNQPDADEYQQAESSRRSLYMPIIRNELPSVLTVFDFADPDLVVGKRPVTNVPAQALFLMNSPFIMNASRNSALELCSDSTLTVGQLINRAYLRLLSRRPDAEEIQAAAEFLGQPDLTQTIAESLQSSTDFNNAPLVLNLTRFIHVIIASTEFRMLN